jgi:hypothetical protein
VSAINSNIKLQYQNQQTNLYLNTQLCLCYQLLVTRFDYRDDMIQPCQAVIAISDIRLPLEWKEFEHNKGKVGM